jgi:hypothetical protein
MFFPRAAALLTKTWSRCGISGLGVIPSLLFSGTVNVQRYYELSRKLIYIMDVRERDYGSSRLVQKLRGVKTLQELCCDCIVYRYVWPRHLRICHHLGFLKDNVCESNPHIKASETKY